MYVYIYISIYAYNKHYLARLKMHLECHTDAITQLTREQTT